jgi:uncharacterized membrane protein
MFILGAVMDFAALGFLPASLALPLGGIGLTISSLFASRYLNEVFTTRDLIGTLLIIVGSWSAVLFSRKVDLALTADELLSRFSLLSTSGVYVLGCVVFNTALYSAYQHRFRNAVVASVIPGSFGAFGNIGGKGTAELLKMTFSGNNQFKDLFTYLFIAFAVTMLVLQNHFLQVALSAYDQVIVVPVYYVSVCIFSVMGGIFFFGEWTETTSLQDLLFTTGVVVIFVGVYFLTKVLPEKEREREKKTCAPPESSNQFFFFPFSLFQFLLL